MLGSVTLNSPQVRASSVFAADLIKRQREQNIEKVIVKNIIFTVLKSDATFRYLLYLIVFLPLPLFISGTDGGIRAVSHHNLMHVGLQGANSFVTSSKPRSPGPTLLDFPPPVSLRYIYSQSSLLTS